GGDVAASFAQTLVKRELKNIILITQTTNPEPNGEALFEIIVTPFNNQPTFISQNSNAWKISGVGVKDTFTRMFNGIYREELDVQSYLIIDVPEFFTDTDI